MDGVCSFGTGDHEMVENAGKIKKKKLVSESGVKILLLFLYETFGNLKI